MRFIAHFTAWTVRLAIFAAASIGLSMAVLVFISVVSRYVAHAPLRFTDELIGLMFSACVFISIPYVCAMGLNIRVTLLVDHFPEDVRRVASAVAEIMTVVFFLIIGKLGYDFAATSFMFDARSDVARLPVAYWMSLISVSAYLSAIVVVVKGIYDTIGRPIGTPAERRISEGAL